MTLVLAKKLPTALMSSKSSKKQSFQGDGYEVFDTKAYGKSKLTILRLIRSGSIE